MTSYLISVIQISTFNLNNSNSRKPCFKLKLNPESGFKVHKVQWIVRRLLLLCNFSFYNSFYQVKGWSAMTSGSAKRPTKRVFIFFDFLISHFHSISVFRNGLYQHKKRPSLYIWLSGVRIAQVGPIDVKYPSSLATQI